MGRGHVHQRLGVRYLEYRALQWTQALTTQSSTGSYRLAPAAID